MNIDHFSNCDNNNIKWLRAHVRGPWACLRAGTLSVPAQGLVPLLSIIALIQYYTALWVG